YSSDRHEDKPIDGDVVKKPHEKYRKHSQDRGDSPGRQSDLPARPIRTDNLQRQSHPVKRGISGGPSSYDYSEYTSQTSGLVGHQSRLHLPADRGHHHTRSDPGHQMTWKDAEC